GALQVTDHLLAKHRLRALSATRFAPEGPFYASTQFIFSRKAADVPFSFVSQWDEAGNRGRLELEAVALVVLTPDQLADYAGEYVSEELAATYRLTTRNNQLWLRVNSRRWEQLDVTVCDEFIPHLRDPVDGRIIRFLRDDRGKVTGLSADYF